MSEQSSPVDAAAVVFAIRDEVARRRAAGEYPQALLDRLDAEFDPVGPEQPLESMAHLETVRPLGSPRRRLGRGAVIAKRAVRRGIAWYVRPLAEDQTRFNFAVVRRLYELENRLARLEEELEAERSNRRPRGKR
jgi:hypothetical protein